MTPLQKALQKLNTKWVTEFPGLGTKWYIESTEVEKVLQEFEVDILNQFDQQTKSTWKESSNQSDLPRGEIIKDILKLHCEGKNIDCDPTYSKGNFYKKSDISEPRYRFDISPVVEGVEQADCRNLPLENESVDVIMFDPPFLISKGPSLLVQKEGSNIISSRFSSFENPEQLLTMYYDSLKEFYRVLKRGGTIIFKCQDQISGGLQHLVHYEIINMCKEADEVDFSYYVKDLFVLIAKNRINSGKWKIQRHARKHHCYFLVLKKI